MKRLILGCLCLGILASCNVTSSDEYKKLQAENDSLKNIVTKGQSDQAELQDIINEVEANFAKIKEAEKFLSVEAGGKGELSADTKSRITDNFQMINEILQKNKADIANLNNRMKGAKGVSSGMQKTIERLNSELEERTKTITELQTALASRDKQIAELTQNIVGLNANVEQLASQTAEQAGKLKEQDKELNAAYYIFGTSKELKEAKVVSGGFLSSNKVMKESIDKSIFIQIDIRDVREIPIYSKKAKVLSEHPKASYNLVKDGNGKISLQILDYQKFWSLTKYLVIEAN